jgi:hypothetical protein
VAVGLTLFAALMPAAGAVTRTSFSSGTSYARISATQAVLGNALVERTWDLAAFGTANFIDKRTGNADWAAPHADFSLNIGGVPLASTSFVVTSTSVKQLAKGLRLTFSLTSPTIDVLRTVEVYDGIAGLRTRTVLQPKVPLVLSGYSLDEVSVGSATPTIHAFRAGADWRTDPGWAPQVSIGDDHAGAWRESTSAGEGEDLSGPAQWISTRRGQSTLFMVMERNDFPSSRATYTDGAVSIGVDYSRDVLSIGPFEENGHAENPTDGPGRSRLLQPGRPFEMESSFTGVGATQDDEAWQFHKYLVDRRLTPYDHEVTFNSNGTDSNQISTGAKDDMNYDTVVAVADKARRLGIDTFILDDGWQAISGDWQPDSPAYPEPRWDGSPTSKFRPRFPDEDFVAVRRAIAPMKLGLWMSPMHFNPASKTYQQHPEWACAPLGHALVAANVADPNGGSNEAGLGMWGPDAIPHIENRIRDAIENWHVEYFKFDFLVWADCTGQGDMYDYHDRFVAMLDRLKADHPDVTFQIDETNDYRLFPFDSVDRGPSWFQNGSPEIDRLLHNMWNLSPYIPAFSLGQHFLGGRAWQRYPVSTIMAAALPSHLTFFNDLRELPDDLVAPVREWLDFYKAHSDAFAQTIYPLLADPASDEWTALQSWNPEAGRGALLTFRQKGEAGTTTVPLRNVPPGRTFDVYEAPTNTFIGTYTSAQLSSGLSVTLPTDGASVLLITLHA